MAHVISIHGTNRVIRVQADQTILDAAIASGIDYPHGCRSGRCGACKTRLVEGDVEMLAHTPFALSEAERQDGYILACRAVPRTDGSILLPGQDEVPPEHPRQDLLCRVISTFSATHDIRHIRLAVESGGPFTYSPGQDRLEFLVRRVPGGITSTRMTSSLKIGDVVQVEGPFGSAYLRERHAGPILCVAGGSGLAPIKSIVAAAAVAGLEQPISVYFGARSERDLYLVEWFTALRSTHPNLTFIPVLSEPDAPTAHRTGLVADAIASDLTDLDGSSNRGPLCK
jgi:CDP-4-dehydro-6-deoxyglucose reductase/ferredoxin-NAD(P)+ reductase (naphthalene dioxygenase ferredoxin-specific)